MSLKQLSILISDTSDISELLPLILLLVVKPKEKKYNILQFYFLCSASLKIYALITSKFGINNMHAYHMLALVELVFLYTFYAVLLSKRRSFYGGLVFLVLFTISHTLYYNKMNEFNNVAWGINTATLILLGYSYYYMLYKQFELIRIEKFPLFYINAGFLIYASGSFFTYLFGWKILSKEAVGLFHNAWLIQSVSNLIKNMVITFGIWLMKQK